MTADTGAHDLFLELSAVLTGFSTFRLTATGQAKLYFSTIKETAGADTVTKLLDAFSAARRDASDEASLERALRHHILGDDRLGPVARRLIKLWYVGTWYELPPEWQEAYGSNEQDRTFVVSAQSYVEGLMWQAIAANPSGAKPLGYGMWAVPPRIEEV